MLSRESYHKVLKCAYVILDFNEKHLSIFGILLRDEMHAIFTLQLL